MSSQQFACVSIAFFAHHHTALISAQRLAWFNHPDWDCSQVREKIDFSRALNKLKEHLLEAKKGLQFADETEEQSHHYSRYINQLENVKTIMENEQKDRTRTDGMATSADDLITPTMNDIPMLFDDNWMWDAGGPWDFQYDMTMN